MAKRTRPLLMTGVALASATAIVTASPAIIPSNDLMIAAAPTPTKLSYAQYELTSITDITWQGIVDAYLAGYGGYIGSCCTTDALADLDPGPSVPADRPYVVGPDDPNYSEIINNDYGIDTSTGVYAGLDDGQGGTTQPYPNDPYYPNINPAVQVSNTQWQYDQNGIYLTGVPGVLYYLTDQLLDTFTALTGIGINLDNYYFEAGGIPALVYVGASELFGPIAGTIVATIQSLPQVIAATFVTATQALPTIDLGLIKVGGGILANYYFYGYNYADSGSYYYGLPAIGAYIVDSIIKATLPSSVAAIPAAAKSVAATTFSAPAPATETSSTETVADKTSTDPKADEPKTDSSTEGTDSSTKGTDSSTEGTDSSTKGTDSSTEGTDSSTKGTDSSTEGTDSTGGSSTKGDDSTAGSTSDSSTPAPKPAATPKAPTQRAHTRASDNPLSRLGKKISDAVSGKKSSDSKSSSSSSSSDSGSSGSSSSGS